ncbi:aldo/keto reductase [Bacillus sp. HMF5848]|uniref:aldo/keto reductase n=1 Tax=Bacillus sp. HMF5848 TaxID=2495421 RepID=UPI000F778582|nr:aldo/keto reductase [Bacillus sp. HMF5848]RSK29046.1 aldo/keto reductase [Bacillus sp. HMF5848]
MKTRTLGDTGIHVSEVGFGAWQLGNDKDWSAMTETEAMHLVHAALSEGCNFFDTAPNYGSGNSETLLGKALKGKRDQVVINTKFGHHADGTLNFDVNALRYSVEGSLRRLQTDYVDTILLHNPPYELLNGDSPHYEVLEQLKAEGKIRAYGASVDSSKDMLQLIETTNSKVIEVLFNIMHQETTQAFNKAKEKGVGLIAKVPLDSGWLSGKYDAGSVFHDIRSRWTDADKVRRTALIQQIKELTHYEPKLNRTALRFILAHEEISTVIPGVKNLSQLQENMAAASERMPQELVEKLHEFWREHIEKQPLPW